MPLVTQPNNPTTATTAGTDAAGGHQQPPVTQPNNLRTTRNVGTEAAWGPQQSAGQRDMRKDGSRLVARRPQLTPFQENARQKLTAEQEKHVREVWKNAIPRHRLQCEPPTGRQETEDNENPMETSEDNGSDSTYCESTDSMMVH